MRKFTFSPKLAASGHNMRYSCVLFRPAVAAPPFRQVFHLKVRCATRLILNTPVSAINEEICPSDGGLFLHVAGGGGKRW